MVLSNSYTDFPNDEDLLDDLNQLLEIKLSGDKKTLHLAFSDSGIDTLKNFGAPDLSTFLEALNPFNKDVIVKTVHPRGCIWTSSMTFDNGSIDELRNEMDSVILGRFASF